MIHVAYSNSLAGFSARRCFWDFWQHWHWIFFSVWLIICIHRELIKECPSASDSSCHLFFFKFSGTLPSRSLEVLWPKLPRWLQTSQKLDFFRASCALNLSARLLFDRQLARFWQVTLKEITNASLCHALNCIDTVANPALLVISIVWPSKNSDKTREMTATYL